MPPPTHHPRSRGRAGHKWRKATAHVRRTQDVCHLCGLPIDKTLPSTHAKSFTVDHVEPLSLNQDRALDRSNLQAAHRDCNSRKGNKAADNVQRHSRNW